VWGREKEFLLGRGGRERQFIDNEGVKTRGIP